MNILNHIRTDFVRAALMVLLAVVTFPTAAWATNVQYLDANGQSQTANAVAFTSSNADISLDGGWYYVNGNVTINGKITFTGNVNLILCDGASLTVTYNSYPAAINSDNKKNLTIYAQSTGNNMGSLTANGTCCINTGGNITIYGGKVTANSNGYETIGIYAQNVYIFGGQVRATGSYGIAADGDVGIRLQCRNENDYIWVSRFSYLTQAENNGSIQANNLVAYDANTGVIGSVVNGTVTNFSTISGKVLRPIDNWGGDDGTAEHPYVITTTAGLDLLAKKVNGTDGYTANDFSGKYFVLGNDITYSYEGLGDTESNYTAIGVFFSSIKKFEGSFNGQGHTVKGIRICKDGNSNDDDYQGLFGRIGEGGSVSHVTVSDARIIGRRNIGGIVGSNWGGTITDCHVTASVFIKSVQSSAHYHGGIVGFNKTSNGGGIVSGCSSSAVITLANGLGDCQGYGGIVGSNQLGTVKDCLYLGKQIGGSSYVGAIAGYNVGTIKNCYYTNSDIKGKDEYYNEVTLSSGNPVIGYTEGSSTVTNVGLAHTITLGKDVAIDGTETDYAEDVTNPKRRITTYIKNEKGIALRLDTLNGTKTDTIYYCVAGAKVPLSYSGTSESGVIFRATKTNGGDDVTSSVIEGSTLTMPDYDVTVRAIDSFDLSFAAANDLSIESGKATVTVDGVDVTLTNGKLTGVKPGSKVTVTAAEGYKFKNAGGERLLTTIKPASSNAVTPFYVTQGVATLTIVGNDIKNEGYGWVNTSSDDNLLTITPATGYDITSVKFKSDTDSEFALGPTFPIYYPIYRVNLKNSRIKQRVLVYGDYSRSYVMEDLPFRPGSWNAAAMRFSDTDGQHFHFLTDEIYWGFKTLIMDVSDVEVGTTMMVHNGWWTATYYDNLPIVNGPNEIQLTEDIARDCAMVNGAGKDLQFLIKSGNCIVNTVYYEDGYGGTSIKEFNIYGYESGGIKDVTINADSTQFSFIMPMGDVTAFYELELMSFPLTIGANRYATYYSDKPMTLGSGQSFAQLYTIASVGTETVSLSEALTVAKANTPLLVYNSADEEKTVTLCFSSGTSDNVTANSAFKGTISDKTFTEAEMNAAQHYVLVGGTTFLRVDKPGTIAANRCWLEVANASARQLTIGDRTLNIKDERFNIDEAGTMYDLQGRRLTKKPTKAGVYVKNGQKVVVK